MTSTRKRHSGSQFCFNKFAPLTLIVTVLVCIAFFLVLFSQDGRSGILGATPLAIVYFLALMGLMFVYGLLPGTIFATLLELGFFFGVMKRSWTASIYAAIAGSAGGLAFLALLPAGKTNTQRAAIIFVGGAIVGVIVEFLGRHMLPNTPPKTRPESLVVH